MRGYPDCNVVARHSVGAGCYNPPHRDPAGTAVVIPARIEGPLRPMRARLA